MTEEAQQDQEDQELAPQLALQFRKTTDAMLLASRNGCECVPCAILRGAWGNLLQSVEERYRGQG